jgi:LssY C-terminus
MNSCLFLGLVLGVIARAISVPAGAELHVRLTSEVTSEKPSGQPISAVLIAPVLIDGVPAVSAGTRLVGETADAAAAKPATEQSAEQPATVRIQFTQIQDDAGHSRSVSCIVESIDNARESVDDSGLITGITASETVTARLDQGIKKLGAQYQSLAELLGGIKGVLIKEVDSSIDYRPGAEVMLKLTKSLEWNAPLVAKLPIDITPAIVLTRLVNSQPSRTTAANPPKPSDLTNVMFIGAREQLVAAFHEAGWFTADRLNEVSKFETARAIIESRGYREAPISLLMLDERPPELAFQKQNNTFAMRHHIRIWLRPQTFHGKPVWVAAATHDMTITFSPESRSFTHGIDSHIDDERAKIVNDILFTGRVHAVALVDRTGIPTTATNATGHSLITDGKMAVLEF